jgi:hypothetical protein
MSLLVLQPIAFLGDIFLAVFLFFFYVLPSLSLVRHVKHIFSIDDLLFHSFRIVCPVKAQVLFYCLGFCNRVAWCRRLLLDYRIINNVCYCLYVMSTGGCYNGRYGNSVFVCKIAFLCSVCPCL